ncbi:mandelate racemase/muconate lactonizing enzyme family protein [Variovorax sp. YR216]|uniref:mandelate racemase/muconate lactonizing enzyme family protein n=1 Tax=Variovorax sp. YR216 TaxID=1882828 RepID=UPI00089A1E69|nr:mandelate racemase/muconate lactonizing enzyme family protein [Variovorax sp. YR216]SEB25078.1 L-alanine-DL-glutamate epimerase [Variovorax sp. YR216]
MKITKIDVIEAVVPFDDGSGTPIHTSGKWTTLDMVLVRLETDTGLVGWGECFAYSCRTAVAAAARDMVAPLVQGRDLPEQPEALTLELQQRLHIFGRYGIAMFAISGFDIALWDLAAQVRSVPLHALLGSARESLTAYASLVRYGDVSLVDKHCRDAVREGYRYVKLHEIDPEVIRAGRAACGPDIGISVDVNCAWTPEVARARIGVLREVNAQWVEEPVFPPEDIRNQAALNCDFPVGAGENACTRHEFARMVEAKAVTFAQPSVIKVGGISEFMAAAQVAQSHGVAVMPHSPYFGPGYFATLHVSSVLTGEPLFEHLYVRPHADIALGGTPLPKEGRVRVPQAVGLGFSLDMQAIKPFRV